MDPRTSERIGWGTIAAAALGVGVLLGARFCAPPPGGAPGSGAQGPEARGERQWVRREDCPERVVTRTVEAEPKVIYECPPEPEPEPAEGVAVARKEELPEPEPPMDPLTRQRLLAWVRDQSEELGACRDEAPEIYRLAVILHLEREGDGVRRVDLNVTRGEVSSGTLGCIRQRLRRWEPPRELTRGRTQLVFGLTL